MGNEMSTRTKKALIGAVEKAKSTPDESIENEKEENDFLEGVLAVVNAIQNG